MTDERVISSKEMNNIKYSNFVLAFVCLLIATPHTLCHNIGDVYRVIKDRLAHYDKTIRPTYNQSLHTIVSFSLGLSVLQELDEVNQKLTVIGSVYLTWTDDMMKWDPAQYGNMTEIVTESERFWTPNLVLVNSAENIHQVGNDWQAIRYSADGRAYYIPTNMFSVSCRMDVTFYPWDQHLCSLSFIPQSYNPSEVFIMQSSEKVDMTYYTPNGAWKYVDSLIYNHISEYFSVVNVFFLFERRPRFFIVNVILPIIFLAFLSIIVFLIPPDSGERISYTITMLLAIAVFLTLVGDNLPKTSDTMPIFCYYLMAMLAANICITLSTVFNLRIYHTDPDREPVSGCWAKLVTCCKFNRRKEVIDPSNNLSSTKVSSGSNSRNIFIIDETTKPGQINGHKGNQHYPDVETAVEQQKRPNESAYAISSKDTDFKDVVTWKDVSGVIDKILFCFFCIIFIAATVAYLVIALDSDQPTIQDILDQYSWNF